MAGLSLKTKISFGMGGIALTLPDMVFTQWIFMRYVPNEKDALLSASLFGIIFLTARIIGAVAEPLIGHWSDSCRTRWGRRLPFIRFGLLPLVIFFFLMWHPPITAPIWLRAIYAYFIIQIYLLFYPGVLTPYLSLLTELGEESMDRVRLMTAQGVFVMLGSVVFALVGVVKENYGWTMMSLLVAFLTFTSLLPIAITGKERNIPKDDERKVSFFQSAIWVLRSRSFLHLVFGTSFYFLAFTSIVMSLPFWVKEYLGKGEAYVTYLMIPLLLITMCLFVFVGPTVERFGKYRVFSLTLLLASLGLFMLSGVGLFPIGSAFSHLLFIVMWMGIPVAGLAVLPFAILTDVIDEDEKKTGTRRDAIFFAIQGTIQKIFIGVSGGIFSVLAYWGSGSNVTEQGLRLVAIAGGLSAFIGFLIFLGYPLKNIDVKQK